MSLSLHTSSHLRENMNAGATGENSQTIYRPESAQAGEESISIKIVKKVNGKNQKRESMHKNQFPRQNYAQIDLQHNSEISDFLYTSSNKPIRETKQEDYDSDKIIPFEFDISRLNVNETVDNNTKLEYLENEFRTGKAKKIDQTMTPHGIDTTERRRNRIRTLEGEEVSTSSINITDYLNNKKVIPKNEKITKLNQNL
mmetsp:Transcript_17129/g.15102  ORF Transcript_17129/g.15102 Transcript_17129/m.15102 type:complete len:199 (+) Transcript_17129:845-1441(+)